jgi:L-arabinose isomerase
MSTQDTALRIKAEHALRSRNYKTRLKQAVESGDFEQIVKSIMLLAVKHNDETDWKASPRTFMELLQVMHKYKVEFGSADGDFDEILRVIDGGADN